MSKTPDFKTNRDLVDVINDLRKPEPLPETGWNLVGPDEEHGVDFQNGWDNEGTGHVPCSWYLSEDGEVRLRGRVIQ